MKDKFYHELTEEELEKLFGRAKIDPDERIDVLSGLSEEEAKKDKGGHGRIDSLNGSLAYFEHHLKRFTKD